MDDNKKGISPLIATVLLVGLVVTIAMVVFFWYGNYLEEFLNKQGVELEASCTQDVQIYLSELSCDTYTGETFLNFKIENQGSATLRGLNVAYILDSSSFCILNNSISKLKSKFAQYFFPFFPSRALL